MWAHSKRLLYSLCRPARSGGGGSEWDVMGLPQQRHDSHGADLRLQDLHAHLPALRHPPGVHAQPQGPSALLLDSQPGHGRQPGAHLLLLHNGMDLTHAHMQRERLAHMHTQPYRLTVLVLVASCFADAPSLWGKL